MQPLAETLEGVERDAGGAIVKLAVTKRNFPNLQPGLPIASRRLIGPAPKPQRAIGPVKIGKRRLPRAFKRGMEFLFDPDRRPANGELGLVRLKSGAAHFGYVLTGPRGELLAVQPLNQRLTPALVSRCHVASLCRCLAINLGRNRDGAVEGRLARLRQPMNGSERRLRHATSAMANLENLFREDCDREDRLGENLADGRTAGTLDRPRAAASGGAAFAGLSAS